MTEARIIAYAAAAFAIIGALVGAYLEGRHDGAAVERAAWLQREQQINADVQAAKDAAAERVREAERSAAARLVAASTDYQRELERGENERADLVERVRTGARRLSIHATCDAAGADSMPGAAAGAGRRDGGARAELSQADGDALIAIAADADRVARQLAACQAVVRADRAGRPP